MTAVESILVLFLANTWCKFLMKWSENLETLTVGHFSGHTAEEFGGGSGDLREF